MRFQIAFVPAFLVFLSGCIADQKQTQADTLRNNAAPTINIPAPALMTPDVARTAVGGEVDRATGAAMANLRNDIASSSNNTQQQLSGLVTTQISKLAESIKGIEANLSTQITANATATANLTNQMTASATATANLEAKVETSLTANVALQNTMMATLNNNIQANADLRIALDHLTAQVQATAAAQVGFGNKIDQVSTAATAGHDVNTNNFPKEAVTVMLDEQRSSNTRLLAILGVIQAVLLLVLRNSRERERLRADNEKLEHQQTTNLLMEALTHTDPTKTTELRAKLAARPTITMPKGLVRNLI